jgi:hypothetical protein
MKLRLTKQQIKGILNSVKNKSIENLQGRVKFPTGGRAREPKG